MSFNLITHGDVQGVPLIDMAAADILAPVIAGLRSNVLTARAAARQMVAQGSGVILSLTSGTSQGTAPGMGGTGPADAATESFMRQLAAELGGPRVRVVGMWTAGVPETFELDHDSNATRRASGLTAAQIAPSSTSPAGWSPADRDPAAGPYRGTDVGTWLVGGIGGPVASPLMSGVP